MKALPLPKTKEIVERINALQASSPYYIDSTEISDFSRELRIIKRDIDSMFKVDACAAWEMTGAWKALLGDQDGVNEAFRASLALGYTGTNRANWSVNCLNVGLFTKAQQLYGEFGGPESDFFSTLVAVGVRAGAFAQTARFVERAREMKISWDERSAADVSVASDILQTAGITDEQVARHLDVAGVVLRRHNIHPTSHPRVTVADGFFRGVTVSFIVPVSSDEAFEMNVELASEEVQSDVEKSLAFDVVFEAGLV
ncbi:hypothetical protein [Burkholderia pyrrocinia]|uniref:hypothetical protein n=1 Tax=Burkholderia pyrrocinia TaxID=60550 RepID=UPI002AB0EAAE|nr:hypothetical protein [Burkholderia pyrrocinia]